MPPVFFANIEKANYAISHGHLSKAYLKEAAAYLHNMDSIYRIHPEKFLLFSPEIYYRRLLSGNGQLEQNVLEQSPATV